MISRNKYHKPPRFSEWLLECLFPDRKTYTLAGDISETYQEQIKEQGRFRARWWYRTQLLKALPPLIKDNIYWSLVMLKNYLKTALRNIQKHKIFSIVNISGLAVSMTCSFLIFIWVKNELSYDRFHEKADCIYRVVTEHSSDGKTDIFPSSPAPLAQALMEEIPEVKQAIRLEEYGDVRLVSGSKQFWGNRCFLTDSAFFDLFSFPLIKGDPRTALNSVDSIVITEETALKCFGDAEPLGRILTIGSQSPKDFKVTGVLQNIPKNSHLQFDFLLSFSILKYNLAWNCWNYMTYALLSSPEAKTEVESKIPELLKKRNKEYYKLHFQPLTHIHLRSSFRSDFDTNGKISHVYLFTVMGIMLLLLAGINFINLCTARAAIRQKEVGVRRVIGASRHQLIRQFIGESIFFALLAFIISLVLLWIFLPYFNTLLNQDLGFPLSQDLSSLLIMASLALIVGLLSGIYPAYIISAFHPKQILSGGFTKQGSRHSAFLRKFLVATQFSISILFITSSLLIRNQLHYMADKDLGYLKEQIVILPFEKVLPAYGQQELSQRQESIKTKILNDPNIIDATFSSFSLHRSCAHQSVWWEGQTNDDILMDWISVDYDFFKTLQIEFQEGRPFSREFQTDPELAYILNESAAKKTGWPHVVGKQFQIPGPRKRGTVIGVVQDFHYKSLHMEIQPLVITLGRSLYYMLIKVKPDNLPSTLAYIKNTWNDFFSGHVFEYYFLDEGFERVYRSEIRMGKLFNTIAGVAILVAALGLFGLVSFTTERRTKEIGIRRVLGAPVSRIALVLTRESFTCILLANIIAWPIAWYAMNKWLANFAYRVDLTVWPFIKAGGLVILIALLTIAFQILKATSANPVDSLRYE